MKLQTKVQKIICFLILLSSALSFFVSLGLVTDLYKLSMARDWGVEGVEVFWDIQPFNRLLVQINIVLIVIAVFLFVTRTHDRRRYYISNYIITILVAITNFVTSIWAIINVKNYRYKFVHGVDFEAWLSKREIIPDLPYTESTFWLDFNIAVRVLLIIMILLLLANLIWKISLMKYEDKLLSGEIKPDNGQAPKEVESC